MSQIISEIMEWCQNDMEYLQELIDNLNDGEVIELDKNYTYSESSDDFLIIQNRKNIRIKGNGYALDGNNNGYNET